MPRVKSGVAHHARKKKIMQAPRAPAVAGASSTRPPRRPPNGRCGTRIATGARRRVTSARLWITRINAAARIHGIHYSRLMAGLEKAGVEIDRKMLADLAVHDADAFAKIAELAKSAV